MKKLFILLYIIWIIPETLGQKTFDGVITDNQGNSLSNVMVLTNTSKLITSSDMNGKYIIKHVPDDSIICFRAIGFKDTCILIKNLQSIIQLQRETFYLPEIYVRNDKQIQQKLQAIKTGSITFRIDSIRRLPTISGQTDPLKILELSPGVSKNEFSYGINIRGGSSDQTLVIFDDAVIYNPMHLSGFLSVFNPIVIDKVTLYKSGIPSEYPGRLSSAMIIETKQKWPEKTEMEGNMGLLLSGIGVKIPVNSRIDLSLAARQSYIDYTVKPVSKFLFPNNRSLFNNTQYYFNDFNLQMKFKLSPVDNIYISSFYAKDDFVLHKASFNLKYGLIWDNLTTSLKWNHYFNNYHISKTIFYYSKGKLDLFLGQNDFYYSLNSLIQDYSLRHEHQFFFNRITAKIGIQALKQTIIPNKSEAQLNDLQANFGTPNDYHVYTISCYASTDVKITDRLSANASVRGNYYMHQGPFYQFIRSFDGSIRDTLFYNSHQLVKSYHNLEPQVGINYSINKFSTVKFHVGQSVQYIQQVNVSSVTLPTDFWMPASLLIKPGTAFQMTMGYVRSFNHHIDLTIDFFYKHMNNLTEFKKGITSTITKATMEENIIIGKGRAIGGEIMIEKKSGKINGWLSYTLSKSDRIFNEINNGNPFPSKYDRRHNLSLVLQYELNRKWYISSIFTYATGQAVTLPVGRYMIGENIINQYVNYNSFRMPAYHRFDVSLAHSFDLKYGKEHELVFSIYNVYNRLNPFFMYFQVTGDLNRYRLKVTPKYVSIFPILPSVSYRFKF